jgi:hypothetical protein
VRSICRQMEEHQGNELKGLSHTITGTGNMSELY